jgi:hypothetical protein
MKTEKIIILFNVSLVIISGIISLLPNFPFPTLWRFSIYNLIISLIFLIMSIKIENKIEKNSFFWGCLISYSLLQIEYVYCVLDVLLAATQEKLLGYQFAVLYYISIPIIIVGGLIGLGINLFKIIKKK